METIVQRSDTFAWSKNTCLAQFDGVEEVALVGDKNIVEDLPASKLSWSHGFVVRGLKLQNNALVPEHIRFEEEVIFVQQGRLDITVDGETLSLSKGDTFTTPIESVRKFEQKGQGECVLYITRRNDHPKAPKFI